MIGVATQSIERCRMPNRLTTSRMSDQGYLIEIDFALEKIARFFVESFPDLQVLEQQNAAAVVFTAQSTIDEIHVDGSKDVTAAGHQLAQVAVTGVRNTLHLVIAVRA